MNGGTVVLNSGARLQPTRVTLSGAAMVTEAASLTYSGHWSQSAGTFSVTAGQTATFTGGADSFAGTLAGAGTIAFTAGADTLKATTLTVGALSLAGASVTLSGAIANASKVKLSAGKIVVASAGASLSGAGWVTLGDSAATLVTGATAASTLTVGQIVQGAGKLGGGSMKLVVQAAGTLRSQGVNALIVDTGAATIANAGVIESMAGGGLTIASAVTNTGRLYAQASTLTVNGAVSGTGIGQILGGVLKAASAFNENVTFATGATGTLELAHGQTYAGKITGFSKTGATRLDLDDIAFSATKTKATYAGTAAGGVLTVTDGAHTAKIAFTGDYLTSKWVASSDGHGGTVIVDPPASSATTGPPGSQSLIQAMAAMGGGWAGARAPFASEPRLAHADSGGRLFQVNGLPGATGAMDRSVRF